MAEFVILNIANKTFVQCRYAECHNAECRYAESHGATQGAKASAARRHLCVFGLTTEVANVNAA